MKIYAMFGARPGNTETPELLDAWDEYTRDENEDGFEEARENWLQDSELIAFAVVTFEVDELAIHRALYPKQIEIAATLVASPLSPQGVKQ